MASRPNPPSTNEPLLLPVNASPPVWALVPALPSGIWGRTWAIPPTSVSGPLPDPMPPGLTGVVVVPPAPTSTVVVGATDVDVGAADVVVGAAVVVVVE